MIYLQIAWEFFKIGLFSFGGGYATIPFLYHISEKYGWYTVETLRQMTAAASITPGPVGINVATYAGLNTAGILGSLLATVSEMLPSLILVIITSKVLKKYSENLYIKAILFCLKPISCALLTAVAVNLIRPVLSDIKAIIILGILLLLSIKTKKDPLFYIFLSAIIGLLTVILPF